MVITDQELQEILEQSSAFAIKCPEHQQALKTCLINYQPKSFPASLIETLSLKTSLSLLSVSLGAVLLVVVNFPSKAIEQSSTLPWQVESIINSWSQSESVAVVSAGSEIGLEQLINEVETASEWQVILSPNRNKTSYNTVSLTSFGQVRSMYSGSDFREPKVNWLEYTNDHGQRVAVALDPAMQPLVRLVR